MIGQVMSSLRQLNQDDARSERLSRHTGPVDLIHLDHYTMNDKDLQFEVLELFCGQVNAYVDNLKAARDEAAWMLAAHTLKGAARSIGAWDVASAAEKAEYINEFNNLNDRKQAVLMVEKAVVSAHTYIRTLLKSTTFTKPR